MAPIRRITTFNNPVNPTYGGKAGAKDPRNFLSGNVPGSQWDMVQQAGDTANLYTTPPPHIGELNRTMGIADSVARTLPTKINFVPWTAFQPVATTPILVVPRNPERLDLIIAANSTPTLEFSFGYPLGNNGAFFGVILPFGNMSPRWGTSCPIDDIYMWSAQANQGFLCFEGVQAPEGNQ